MNEDAKQESVHIHSRADELIACLEGEIAKRDEELAACRVAVENCELFRSRIVELELTVFQLNNSVTSHHWENTALRAELAAIKAQEPVAEIAFSDDGYKIGLLGALRNHRLPIGTKLYAAPVSEAKAQGVVMPDERSAFEKWGETLFFSACFERHGSDEYAGRGLQGAWLGWQARAALSDAPVQQVSVPGVSVMARILADRNADACNVNREDNWAIYGQDYIDDVTAMLNAAPAAPAADAGLVLEQAMYTLISIGYHENSGLVHELRQAISAHRAAHAPGGE